MQESTISIDVERIVGPEVFAEFRKQAADENLSIQEAVTQALESNASNYAG
jgi:hypothetical protein